MTTTKAAHTAGRDMMFCPPKELANIAQAAFTLGMEDAEARRPLATAEEVMGTIVRPLGFTGWRIFHRRKIRQVYGAGFDIARAAAEARANG